MTTQVHPGGHAAAANEPMPPGRGAALRGLLGRYRAAFGAAWASRGEMAGPKRLPHELAFLPAAVSLQETPPHPAPRRLALAICALFAATLAWSVFGHLDIVAVAGGRVVVSERTKTIQPLEAGVVRHILVREGDTVQAGQVLVELDPTAAQADHASVAERRQATNAEVRRVETLLEALRTGRAPDPATPRADGAADGATAAATALHRAQTQAEWRDIGARLARLGAEQARREAEVATVREAIGKLEATLPLALQREADVKALAAQGFMSGHAGQDRSRERIELERDLAVQRARLAEAQAAAKEADMQRAAYLAETERALRARQAQAVLEREQLAQQARKAEQRQRLTQLTAPVDGIVQQLAIHTSGGVVTPAQVLMVVVPRHEHGHAEVTAEVVIDNADIGFVNPGQRAVVKLEPFPFTRYGTIGATVEKVAADAVIDERRGAVFPATLRLDRTVIDVDGKSIRLSPGMNLAAEVRTGRRRVIDYWIAPLHKAVSESLGER